MNQVEILKKMKDSPIFFIERMWGLIPQPLICTLPLPHEHSFHCYGKWVRGKHITWQQLKVLEAIESGKTRISVASGNGIGKDALLSWLIHWYLFTHYNAQVGCTAPSANQMYDVLWKELSVWHQRLPKEAHDLFEWSTSHFKIVEHPETWWARARTATKEKPEAFAGLHGDYILLLVDEASGVPDEVITAGEGALTGKHNLVVYVGNPTRLEGFFYDSHHKDRTKWTTFQFDSRESPNVTEQFIKEKIEKYKENSDDFRWAVQGLFPRAEGIDKGGWMPLLQETDLRYTDDPRRFFNPKLGVDPAGEGSNRTAHVLRDPFFAKVVSLEDMSNTKSITERTLTLMSQYDVAIQNCVIDNFGTGANVGVELAVSAHGRPEPINVGEEARDPEKFYNRRAELYWLLREWIIAGGQLVKHEGWKELLTIRYKRTLSNKIQIMSKVQMHDIYGYESPDIADALSLTFYGDTAFGGSPYQEQREVEEKRHTVIHISKVDTGF